MKCWTGDQWQCDEAWITEHVSVRSMLRLWKLTDKLRRGGVCVLGGKDWSWMARKEWREGEDRGLSGIMGYGDDKRGDSIVLSTPSLGPTRGGYQRKPAGGILAHAQRGTLSWPHPAWNLLFSRILPDLHPPFTPDASHRTQLISKHLMSVRQENRPPLNLPVPRPHLALRGRRDGTLQGLMMLQRPQ